MRRSEEKKKKKKRAVCLGYLYKTQRNPRGSSRPNRQRGQHVLNTCKAIQVLRQDAEWLKSPTVISICAHRLEQGLQSCQADWHR